MKMVMGFLLIFLGLVIGYMVITGRLPSSSGAQGGGTMTPPAPVPLSRNFNATRGTL